MTSISTFVDSEIRSCVVSAAALRLRAGKGPSSQGSLLLWGLFVLRIHDFDKYVRRLRDQEGDRWKGSLVPPGDLIPELRLQWV